MIRVYINEDLCKPDNAWSLMITGHAEAPVCAAVGALWRAFLNEVSAIAERNPRHVAVMYATDPKTLSKATHKKKR